MNEEPIGYGWIVGVIIAIIGLLILHGTGDADLTKLFKGYM